DLAQLLRSLVATAQPFPHLAFGGVAIAVHLVRAAAVVRVFVPEIVAQERRVVAVVLDQCRQELPGGGADIRVIETETRKASRSAAAPDAAGEHAAVTGPIPRMRVLAERPLRRVGNQLGNDYFDAVLSR